MNIILSLFDFIYAIIKSIINMHYYIFINIRKKYLDKNYKEHKINNLLSLVFKIIFLSVYEFLVFHIYIFLYLIHIINIGPFGIILRFILTISISCILAYIIGEIGYIFHYLFTLVFSFAFFIFTFNEELRDIILFKREFNGLAELFQVYFLIFIQLYRFLLIIAHFSNIFSIMRIIEICKYNKNWGSTSLLSKSFTYIFFDIFILTP